MKLSRLLWMAVPAIMCGSFALHAAEYPARPIEMVPAGAPGGGLDLTARAIEGALRDDKLIRDPFVMKHMGGAGGNLAKTYIHQKKGDPHFLYVESNRIYLNRIVGTTPLTYTDVTPLGRLTTEYLVWVVLADSPFKTAKDVIAKVKADPSSLTFGIGTAPSNDQMNILRPLMSQGVDVKQVRIAVFKAGGDLMIQLLGGHVPVISTGLSEALEQVKGGKARIIAVSAPNPVPGELAKVPTWKSMGIDVSILHWRGLFAPPGIPAETVKFWDQTLAKMVKSDSWKKSLERHQWFDAYADSVTFRKDLEQENKVYEQILTQLGMAKGLAK
jgi:putative tricarboxylic transport membrane protein